MWWLTIVALSATVYFIREASRRLSAEQVALLTESAYYSALRPDWPQLYVNDKSYAILPEDARCLGLKDGDELTLAELVAHLQNIKEIDECTGLF